jgi:hypothetical protein
MSDIEVERPTSSRETGKIHSKITQTDRQVHIKITPAGRQTRKIHRQITLAGRQTWKIHRQITLADRQTGKNT